MALQPPARTRNDSPLVYPQTPPLPEEHEDSLMCTDEEDLSIALDAPWPPPALDGDDSLHIPMGLISRTPGDLRLATNEDDELDRDLQRLARELDS